MALGVSSNRLKSGYSTMMDYSKQNAKKYAPHPHGVPSPVDEHSSLLFAMQSAFREKLAVRMRTEKSSQVKQKSSENEKSLMEVYERSQKLVKNYHKSKEANARRGVSSGSSNRLKKLPPISLRSNSDSGRFGKTNGFVRREKLHFDSSVDGKFHSDKYKTVKAYAVEKVHDVAPRLSNFSHKSQHPDDSNKQNSNAPFRAKRSVKDKEDIEKFSQPEKILNEDDTPPPNMARLRMLSNKKKQLLKMNARRASTEQNSDSTAPGDGMNPPLPLTDFQKWQLAQDKERQDRLEKYQNAIKPNFETPKLVHDADRPAYEAKPVKVTSNNTRKSKVVARPQKRSLPPTTDTLFNDHTMDPAPVQNEAASSFSDTYSKQSGLSEQLHIYQSNHKIQAMLSNQSMQGMTNLQKPVLVRHDGRSTASSRTSTRNTFYSHSKHANVPADGNKQNQPSRTAMTGFNLPVNYDDAPLNINKTQVIPEQGNVVLVPCNICGRKFSTERLEKHAAVCTKTTSKKRRVFNMSKARRKGTELETFAIVKGVSQGNSEVSPRKSTWRNQHEDFIKTIKQAKMMSVYVKGGGNLADLPPPEPSLNLDYVTCQYCERRFAPKVAERHIPRCKDIKSRPPPPKAKIPRSRR